MLKPTVASITRGFCKLTTQLESLASAKDVEVEAYGAKISTLREKKGEALAESNQARAISRNIKNILEV